MRNRTANRLAAPLVSIPPLTPLALAVALALMAPQAVFGAPTGATVVAGQVQVTQPNAQTTLITQGSDKAILSWRSFSIGAGETVRFQQPDSSSVALNRVTTATPSEIFGRLSANGKVFLVNPSGVLFGKGASVDVGSLVASTLNIDDGDFLAGRYAFAGSADAGAVRNDGVLAAAERGTIALLGAQVSNSGTISARLGTVGLAAGGKVSLDFHGDGLTRIVVDAAGINALVENGGAVIADGGQVTMTARALDALAATVVRQNGVVQANTLVERDGRIFLDGGDGALSMAGKLDATGLAPGQRGGEVTLLGRDITLAAGARIDVRGDAGGGTVLAGGDQQGGNPLGGTPLVPHAASTTMAAGASIRADALGSGDGGKVILWSDGLSRVHGVLSADGGAQGGNGGMVETSGKVLDVTGSQVSAAAPRGRPGAWLLDPTDIDIDTELAASIAQSLNNGTDVTVSTRNGPPSETAGNINVYANIDKTSGGDTTLVLEANNYIAIASDVRIAATAPAGKLHVELNSDVDGREGGVVIMLPGSSVLTNGGDLRIRGQSSPTGQIGQPTYAPDGVQLSGATIDTRAAQRDGGGSGMISIAGSGDSLDGGSGVRIVDTSLLSTTGSITISGTGGFGGGERVSDGVEIRLTGGDRIASGSGDVTIAGTAGANDFGSNGGAGVAVHLERSSSISSASGAISISGAAPAGGSGVSLELDGASVSARQTVIAGSGESGGSGIRAMLLNDARIASTDGALTMSGTGSGNAPGLDITLANSQIAASGGNLQLSGTGGNAHASGVLISSQLDDGPDGSSGAGGVMLASSARLSADRGNLTIAGINGSGSDTADSQISEAGVRLTGLELKTVQGDIRIAGVGVASGNNYPTGVALKNVLATAGGDDKLAPGSIRILGLSSGSSPGLLLDGVTLGGAAASGDIILGARNAGPDPMIAYGANSDWRNSVQTSGRINIRPDDQDYDFGAVPAAALPISVGGAAAGFNVSFAALGIGSAGVSNVVIGSKEQTGAISFNDPTPFLGNLVLQNDGPGSLGIVLASNINVSGQLTLSTGGSVNAPAAAISAHTLLLHGAQPESTFQLTNPGNSVVALGVKFDTPKSLASPAFGDVTYMNNGALVIGNVTGSGFSTATNAAVPIDATDTVVAGDLLARASGNLSLAGNISTLGSSITLVAGGVFDSGGRTLAPAAGDKWLVFADTWAGENRSGVVPDTPRPNYYNCAYGAPCAAAITGNRFVYRAQPVLVLTADNLARLYGDPNPLLTFTQAGLVNGDTLADALSGAYATGTTQSSAVGAYAISGALTSPIGYAVDGRPGTLTVNRAALLISVDDKNKVYGDADPLLTAGVSGFRLGDTASVVSGLTLSAPAGAAATAGSHSILGANATAANYTIGYQPGTLTVAKAALVIGADDKRKRYGDTDPLLTASFSGLKYGDSVAAVAGLTLASATGAAAGAGIHPIMASNGTAANYTLSYLPGTLSVDKAPLLVVADDKAKVYGGVDPALTATMSGFRYADTSVAVSGLTLSAPSGAAASAGSHPIVAAGGGADNYTLSYQPGSLKVDKATLLISADNKAKVYGAAEPLLTATMSGFQYTDTSAAVSGLTLGAPSGAAAGAGIHPIVASNASASNYTFIYAPGVLAVDQAVLTYVAAPTTRFEGAPVRPINGSVSGFAYADTLATATTGALAFTAQATPQSPPGVYAAQGRGLAAVNYRFLQAQANDAALLILPMPVTYRPSIAKDMTFESSNVYAKNFGSPRLCVGTGPLASGSVAGESDDVLALEWSRVRVSPNLSNCLGLGQRNSCSDF